MVLHVAMVHNCYVTACLWNHSKPTAHLVLAHMHEGNTLTMLIFIVAHQTNGPTLSNKKTGRMWKCGVQELVLHVAMVYNGYVSECSWHHSKPTAHLLFALAHEGIAAALTMQMVTRIAAHKLQLAYEPSGLAVSSKTVPRLALRVGISSHMCDMLTPDLVTGRLVRACP
jgi:hypothetical protein